MRMPRSKEATLSSWTITDNNDKASRPLETPHFRNTPHDQLMSISWLEQGASTDQPRERWWS